jgi:hypothetical protein
MVRLFLPLYFKEKDMEKQAIIHLDFEYRYDKVSSYFDLVCGVFKKGSEEPISFDLRDDMTPMKQWLEDNKDSLFVGWNIAGAECQVLTQVMGHQWVMSTEWIDLWVEWKMICLTHPRYFTNKTGMAAAIKSLKLEDRYQADKGAVRDLILSKTSYTKEEMDSIIHYCKEDVNILPLLAKEIVTIFRQCGSVTRAEMIARGRHCRNIAISQQMQTGFPVNAELTRKVFGNRDKLKIAISRQCNELSGFQIYEPKLKGRDPNKVCVGYSFNFKNFSNYLESKGLLNEWERTDTGRLLTEDKYMDEMLSSYRNELAPLYHARNSLKQLSSTDLSTLLTDDGHIKGDYWPFNQKTSRTSPKPKLGFLMNLSPWLRMLIQPTEGQAFVGIDFKSQEVLVAAALSKDKQMLDDYKTDIYAGQASKTGFLPPGATKKSHPKERNAFKPITLGVGFGMQANSLGIRFFGFWKDVAEAKGDDSLIKTMKQCLNDAEKFLIKHQQVYRDYYRYLDRHFTECRKLGYYKSSDGWHYFIDRQRIRSTQIQNVPAQSNGAAMYRRAHDKCVEAGIWVIPLHDAFYFTCKLSEAKDLAKIVSKFMVEAAIETLGHEYGSEMGTETQIFTKELPYYDSRGEDMYRMVCNEVDYPCPPKGSWKKPPEIPNIHVTQE